MFIFEMTNATVYEGELKRKPNSLTVSISTSQRRRPLDPGLQAGPRGCDHVIRA